MMLMIVFTRGLRDPKSRDSVLLQNYKTLTKAAQFARFSEAAVRVAERSPPAAAAAPAATTVNAANFNRTHSTKFSNNSSYRGRGRGGFRKHGYFQAWGGGRGGHHYQPGNYGAGPNARNKNVRCFNCGKPGHITNNRWAPKRQPTQFQFNRDREYVRGGRGANRIANANQVHQPMNEFEASAQITGCINAVPILRAKKQDLLTT